MKFRPATRTEAKPLIGLYSESGCGKTYSALILARGFVGPNGNIGMIETESGRGEAYADPEEYPEIGGYQVLPLRQDFSPRRYGEALVAAEQAKLDALIIDSASHEWESTGGVLSMAAKNQEAGKKGPLVWQRPKLDHQEHFMLKFMQTPIPLVILCMRAKYPMQEVTKPGTSRKEWVRAETLHPKQSEDILYEMFIHGWIDQEHNFHLTRCTSKTLEVAFGQVAPITLDTGRQLRAWAQKAESPKPNAAEEKPAPFGTAGSPALSQDEPPPQQPDEDKYEGTESSVLWDLGQQEANWGVQSLKTWWLGLRDDQRKSLSPQGGCPPDLKQIAADAEKHAAQG